MSIKTPGTSESNTFKTTNADASVAGFMTNDATGVFEYGILGPGGTPVGASMWDFIEEKVITGPASGSIFFTGLNGDTDKVYKLVLHVTRSRPVVPPLWRIRPNSIFSSTTQQTTRFRMRRTNLEDVSFLPGLVFMSPNDGPCSVVAYFNAESGKTRTMISRNNHSRLDTAAFGPVHSIRDQFNSGFWDDSTTVVTSLELDNDTFPGGGSSAEWNALDRVKLYKLNR